MLEQQQAHEFFSLLIPVTEEERRVAHRCPLSVKKVSVTKVSKFDLGRSHSLFAIRLVSFIQIALSVLEEADLWSLDDYGVHECEFCLIISEGGRC